MNELLVAIQGISGMALLKIAIDLGKLLQKIEQHDKRIEKLEDRIY